MCEREATGLGNAGPAGPEVATLQGDHMERTPRPRALQTVDRGVPESHCADGEVPSKQRMRRDGHDDIAGGERDSPPRFEWAQLYSRCLLLTEIPIIVGVVVASQTIRFDDAPVDQVAGSLPLSYWALSAVLSVGWVLAIYFAGGWDATLIAAGRIGVRPLVHGTVYFFALVAVTAFLLRLQVARGYLALALPLGLAGLMASRWIWHSLFDEFRRSGHHLETVVVIGGRTNAVAFASRIREHPESGYRVAGLCLSPGSPTVHLARIQEVNGFPVLGNFDDLMASVRKSGASMVAVAASEDFGADDVRRLAWELERTGVRLAVAPAVADVAGPRMLMSHVADLPLMHIVEPTFRGPRLIVKTALDLVLATVALVLLAPVMLLVAAAVKLHDGGPVFFRHERVGLRGRHFRVLKFRSMTPGANRQVDKVRQDTGTTESVFFKAADDPRITPIGRFIRRTSLDELPQLLNVLGGQMSIVGPRPLVPGEGASIESFVERRILVKPGITGLWQVSGRSDLSPDQRIRMDFYYVENWSLAGDLVLIGKTVGTVLSGKGAV